MNDLDLIDRFGPGADELSDAAFAAARARLDQAIAADSRPGHARRRSAWMAGAGMSAAAAVAAAFAIVPAITGSQAAVALAPVSPPIFPVTATWLPSGLPHDARFFFYDDIGLGEGSAELTQASYRSGDDGISIAVSDNFGSWGALNKSEADPVVVAGDPGYGFRATGDGGFDPTYSVVWQEADGSVVGVIGHGRFNDARLVERVADSVIDRPQSVDLFLTIAPSGWEVANYQSDNHVIYADPEHPGSTRDQIGLSVRSGVGKDLDDYYGLRDVHDIEVDGRHGVLARGKDTWILEATSPDGQAFALNAPARLTENQMIAVAEGVRHR
jgi:hypothetical protein